MTPERMRVAALAVSARKGVQKDPVDRATFVADHGIAGDAHAGSGLRQVSLLPLPSIRWMERKFGAPLGFGRFGENIVVDGPLADVRLGDRIRIGDAVVLEVTAIGKVCHDGCAIRQVTGDCIMPREGVFTRVVTGGEATPGAMVQICTAAATDGDGGPGEDPCGT